MNEATPKELGYETEDVRASGLVWAAVVLAVIVIVSVAAMTVMFGVLYESREEAVNRMGPMVDLDQRPEGPVLEVDPPRELIEMRIQNAIDTDSYGWVKKESGVVRIPVEQAMKLVVERGIQ